LLRTFTIAAVSPQSSFSADSFRTRKQARHRATKRKAMLMKAMDAVKAERPKRSIVHERARRIQDPRPSMSFCAAVSDGKIVALGNPNATQLLGTDTGFSKDPTGNAYCGDLFAPCKRRRITEVKYMFRPGA